MDTNPDLSQQVRECACRLQESGPRAMAGLFDLTAQRLVRLAVAITRNQHDAEDALQTALLRVADRPELLAKADHPWPYLLRMVRNEALIILRKKKRVHSSSEGLGELATHYQVDEAERAEQFHLIWVAIRKLPPAQSEVVVLKIWEQMTFDRIGAVLEISPATAASRYRYALSKLSRSLAPMQSQESNSSHPLGSSATLGSFGS